MRLLKLVLAGLIAGTLGSALVIVGVLEGWLRAPLAPPGDVRAFADAAVARLDTGNGGNAAFRLIAGGEPVRDHFLSIGEPVDADTLFQVASLSKWVTAWGVMTLVEAGSLALDAPVSDYLTRWQLPASEFDNDGVTVRRLLSHTAGLTDGLGYGGFPPGARLQRLEDSLTRAEDASPNASGRPAVGQEPGSAWTYSGGGYTLLQLLIEEVSGRPFATYLREAVLQPLGMSRSTFEQGLDGVDNVAESFGTDGEPVVLRRYTAAAAAALHTNVADLSRFLLSHLPGPGGEPAGRGVLTAATLEAMRQPHARQLGADIWGLGLILYAPNSDGSFVVGHDGNNEPAINTAARINPKTGDGIIVLETGARLLATELGGEWTFWQTGKADTLEVVSRGARTIMAGMVLVWSVVILGVAVLLWRGRTAAAA